MTEDATKSVSALWTAQRPIGFEFEKKHQGLFRIFYNMILEEIYIIAKEKSSFKDIKYEVIKLFEVVSIFDFSKYMREDEHSITYTNPDHIDKMLKTVYKVREHLRKLFLKFYVDRINSRTKILFLISQDELLSIESINLDKRMETPTEPPAYRASSDDIPLVDWKESWTISTNPGKGSYLNIDFDLDITIENFEKDMMNGFYVVSRGELLGKEFFLIPKKNIAVVLIVDSPKEIDKKKKMTEFLPLLIFSPYYNNHYIRDTFPNKGDRMNDKLEKFFKMQTVLSFDKSQSPFSVNFMKKIKVVSNITDNEQMVLSNMYLEKIVS